MNDVSLERTNDRCTGRFTAMASPCEILLDHDDFPAAAAQVEAAAREAFRIEEKFSRYRQDNLLYRINTANGATLTVDEETARLLDFAAQLHALSDGGFDITSGVLRRAWRFDGSDRVPDVASVQALLPLVGWHKVRWENPQLTLPAGMEIDLGGIGKEYAVDRVFNLVSGMTDAALLVNFGGDLRARGPRRDGSAWQVGLESPQHGEGDARPVETLPLVNGALATSGDARRFLLKDGIRYSHILDPASGWPVQGGPRSATVLAADCVQAGMLATLTLLAGPEADDFLRAQGDIRAWLVW
ncbi:MAG: FAD:protein FMN transferase [Moraxellaceae bacterium]|nr:FAD:protein FMN transferase [Moraxellaceae bacterium]